MRGEGRHLVPILLVREYCRFDEWFSGDVALGHGSAEFVCPLLSRVVQVIFPVVHIHQLGVVIERTPLALVLRHEVVYLSVVFGPLFHRVHVRALS